jgi:hypothetical protein
MGTFGGSPTCVAVTVTPLPTQVLAPGTQYCPRTPHHGVPPRPEPNAIAICETMFSVSEDHVTVTSCTGESIPGRPVVPLGGPYTNCPAGPS